MEAFETSALHDDPYKPTLYKRYVDDTLVIWSHGQEHLEECVNLFNNQEENIKFTVEVEKWLLALPRYFDLWEP